MKKFISIFVIWTCNVNEQFLPIAATSHCLFSAQVNRSPSQALFKKNVLKPLLFIVLRDLSWNTFPSHKPKDSMAEEHELYDSTLLLYLTILRGCTEYEVLDNQRGA